MWVSTRVISKEKRCLNHSRTLLKRFTDVPEPFRNLAVLRIDVPVFYDDARGQRQQTTGKHSLLLPHEIVGAFYRFQLCDLMRKLTGPPGVSSLIWPVSHTHTYIHIDHDISRYGVFPGSTWNSQGSFGILVPRGPYGMVS